MTCAWMWLSTDTFQMFCVQINFKWLNCATSPVLYCLWSTTHGILNMHCKTEISLLIGTYFMGFNRNFMQREKQPLAFSCFHLFGGVESTAKNMYCLLGKHNHVMWQPACLSITFDANNLCASKIVWLFACANLFWSMTTVAPQPKQKLHLKLQSLKISFLLTINTFSTENK